MNATETLNALATIGDIDDARAAGRALRRELLHVAAASEAWCTWDSHAHRVHALLEGLGLVDLEVTSGDGVEVTLTPAGHKAATEPAESVMMWPGGSEP